MGGIAAVVLAAGSSSRFGADKLLHPLTRHGRTMPLAAHSLMPWLETCGQVTVVVRGGARKTRSEIEAALGKEKAAAIRWAVCEGAAEGMASSLACGVHLNRNAAGWLIGLADMPAVPAAAIDRVRSELLSGAALAVPSCNGRRGHPVGFAARYRDELLALRGDAGARHLLARDSVVHVEVGSEGICADIDTPDDIGRLCEISG